jgi:HEAT repeat protein
MSPVTVFFRTLLKSSAIFIGAATIVLNPSLEWRAATHANGAGMRGTSVGAAQAGTEAAIDGLIALLKDTDASVRRAAVEALSELNSRRAVPALSAAL